MSFPNPAFWSNLLATAGIEVCVVVALGIAAQSAFRRAYWKRAMWQMTLLCLVLIFASEWTGAGRGAVMSLFGKKRIEQTSAPQTVSSNIEFYTTKSLSAVSAPLPAPQKPVWWPGLIWLAGTVIVLGRMATAQCLLFLIRFRRKKIVDSILEKRVARVAKMLGLRRKVCLLRLPESISPMAFGILFPTIGLPPGFETGFSALEQDAILAHELAHLAALDPLWFRLADFASALLWWHPLIWWARRSLHGASELAADEATALVPDGPGSLAHCLVSLGKKMTVSRGWGWTGINGGFRSKLGKRVERLTHLSAGHGKPFVGWRDRLMRIAATFLIVPSIILLFGAFQTAKGEKENAWRKSWNSSPGVLLAMAALDATESPTNEETISERVTNAKLLYEMGKLSESKKILMEVLKDDPSNKTALYYLDMIKEAQFMDRARKKGQSPQSIPTKEETIAERITDAKLLYEMGKISESEKILTQILKEHPSNETAAYYMDLIKETQLAKNAEALITTVGQGTIISKLNSLTMDSVEYDMPLTSVLARLRVWSQKADSTGLGVKFLIDDYAENSWGAISVLPHPRTDMGSVKIKISPALHDVRLKEILEAIVMCADQPIQYKIEDYGVVFSPKSPEQVTLYSKTFHLDPVTFKENLLKVSGLVSGNSESDVEKTTEGKPADDGARRADDGHDSLGGPASSSSRVGLNFVQQTNDTVQLDQRVRAYFAGLGVDMTEPGKSIFYNDRKGLMLVRVTAEDLQVIERAIGSLDQTSPQAIPEPAKAETPYTKAFPLNSEFKKNLVAAVGSVPGTEVLRTNDTAQFNQQLQAYFAKVGAKITPPDETIVSDDRASVLIVRATSEKLQIIEQAIQPLNKVPAQLTIEADVVELSQQEARELGFEHFWQTKETNLTSVLTPSQYRVAINSIKQNTHEDLLTMVRITTLSGRQAHVAAQDLRDNVLVGPAYDMIPTVLEDGYTIKAVFIPTYTDFLQNDPPGTFTPSASDSSSAPVAAKSPLPHYRVRKVALSCDVRDGHTLVSGQLVNDKPSEPKKLELYFVTPTIIDAAGNRVHTEEELSGKP